MQSIKISISSAKQCTIGGWWAIKWIWGLALTQNYSLRWLKVRWLVSFRTRSNWQAGVVLSSLRRNDITRFFITSAGTASELCCSLHNVCILLFFSLPIELNELSLIFWHYFKNTSIYLNLGGYKINSQHPDSQLTSRLRTKLIYSSHI